MNDCRHDWLRQEANLTPVFIIDEWQGPTDAIIQCAACGRFALLRLMHWSGRNLLTRIYGLADLDNNAVSIFLRNMKSAYCDLSRHGAETDMLVATASPITGGVIVKAPEMRVLSHLDASELGQRRMDSWRHRSPDPADPAWLAVLEEHHIDIEQLPTTRP